MNAIISLSSPAKCGADVCHLNLHKTFAMFVIILSGLLHTDVL